MTDPETVAAFEREVLGQRAPGLRPQEARAAEPPPPPARVPDDPTTVTCRLCGQRFRCLGSHLRVHAITSEEYRQLFGDQKLTCAEVAEESRRRNTRWPPERCIAELQRLDAAGEDLSSRVSQRRDSAFHRAVVHRFGSWGAGLAAAGLDREKHNRRGIDWTRDRVVAAIAECRAAGAPLNAKAVERDWFTLLLYARRLFGSWDAALSAAGLDPATVRKRRPPKG